MSCRSGMGMKVGDQRSQPEQSRKVVIGPKLVAHVVTRRDRPPDGIQFGWLICAQSALVSPDRIVGSPCLAGPRRPARSANSVRGDIRHG